MYSIVMWVPRQCCQHPNNALTKQMGIDGDTYTNYFFPNENFGILKTLISLQRYSLCMSSKFSVGATNASACSCVGIFLLFLIIASCWNNRDEINAA